MLKFVLKLIRLPFKILALPLILVSATAMLLVKVTVNISSYLVGALLLFLLLCTAIAVMNQNWIALPILAVIAVAGVAVIFGAVFVEELLRGINERLIGFLHL